MPAGKYRHRVTVRRRTPPTNNGGVPVPATPVTVHARIPARVVSAAAGPMERVFGSQVQASATHLVELPHVALLLSDEIVWHDAAHGTPVDRVLRIAGRHEDEVKRELVLAATEQMS